MDERILPLVSEECLNSIRASYLRDPKYCADLYERVQHENPHIINFIEKMAQESSDSRFVAETSLLLYKILESQTQADELKRTMRL